MQTWRLPYRALLHASRLEISNRAFEVCVTKPSLNRAQIHTGGEMHGREYRPELVQPVAIRIQIRANRIALQRPQHMRIGPAACRAEDKRVTLGILGSERLQSIDQLCWNRNFSFPVRLRCKVILRFPAHVDRASDEVHIVPDAV